MHWALPRDLAEARPRGILSRNNEPDWFDSKMFVFRLAF
jgi:hypothetical protein